jgi:hypothetical protein
MISLFDLVQRGKYKGYPKSLVPVFERHPDLFRDLQSLAERGIDLLHDEEYGCMPDPDRLARLKEMYRNGAVTLARLRAELADLYLELLKWKTAKLYFQEVGIPSGTREYRLRKEFAVAPPDAYEAVRVLEKGVELLEETIGETPGIESGTPPADGPEVAAAADGTPALTPAQKAIRYFDSFSERRAAEPGRLELRGAVRENCLRLLENAAGALGFESILEAVCRTLKESADLVRPLLFQTLQESTVPSLPVEGGKTLPFHLIFNGVKFRIRPSPEELNGGYLLADKHFPSILLNTRGDSYSLLEPGGDEIASLVFEVARGRDGIDLREWFSRNAFAPGDDLIVTVCEYRRRAFTLEHERASDRNNGLVHERSMMLAGVFARLLETAPDKRMFLSALLPRAYAVFEYSREYPPLHWVTIARNDPRLQMAGWDEMRLQD